MRNLILLVLAAFSLSFRPAAPGCPQLQTEGMYVCKTDGEYSALIRFYSDGLVLVTSSDKAYTEVLKWFNREPVNLARVLSGKYKVNKKSCTCSFKVKGESGEQQFEITIRDSNTLGVKITNPAHGTVAKSTTARTYTFFKAG